MAGGGIDEWLECAALRHGVTTLAEATVCGLTRAQWRTLVRRGDWWIPRAGVLVSRSAPSTWQQTFAIAEVSSTGAISHRAGGRLHRLDGFDRFGPEVSIPLHSRRRSIGCPIHRVATLDAKDLTVVDGIRVTSIARTLVDLGAVVSDDMVEQALDDALRRGFSLRWIRETLERLDRPGPSGCGALKRVLARPDRAGPLPDSKFERLVERVCAKAGLPRPERQFNVRGPDGSTVARLDAAWPEIMLGLEAHSDRWHSGTRRGRGDQQRDNRLVALGWELIYVDWAQLQSPAEFVDLVAAAYDLRRQRLAAVHRR